MISTIGFDLGYTLVYLKREEIFRDFLRKHYHVDKSVEEIEIAYHFTDKLFMRHYRGVLGKNPFSYMPWYLGVLNYKLSLESEDLIEQFSRLDKFTKESPLNGWHLYPFAKDVILNLREQGYRTVLISNWDKTARPLLGKMGLLKLFDNITISSEIGYSKPQPQIFEKTLRANNVEPNEFLYVGDNYYDDGVGTRALGIEFLLINRFGRLGIEELSDCKIITSVRDVSTYLAKEVLKDVGISKC